MRGRIFGETTNNSPYAAFGIAEGILPEYELWPTEMSV